MTQLLRLNGASLHDPAIEAWFQRQRPDLAALARPWFDIMRHAGDEVLELLHDGCPVLCLGDVPFAYVNAFTAHVNVGFFQGASLRDPARILEGQGKAMRHVKLRPDAPFDETYLAGLIHFAYAHIKSRVESGD